MNPGYTRSAMANRSTKWRGHCLWFVFATLLALGSAGTCAAETYKIGVLHVERILQQSAAAKAAHDRIEREFKPRDDDITKQEQALRAVQAQYEKERPALSDNERASRARNLDLRSREVERLRQQFSEDLRAAQFEELDKLKGRLDKILTSYAKANGYDLILQDALWVGHSVDITGDVIKALDASTTIDSKAADVKPAGGKAPGGK